MLPAPLVILTDPSEKYVIVKATTAWELPDVVPAAWATAAWAIRARRHTSHPCRLGCSEKNMLYTPGFYSTHPRARTRLYHGHAAGFSHHASAPRETSRETVGQAKRGFTLGHAKQLARRKEPLLSVTRNSWASEKSLYSWNGKGHTMCENTGAWPVYLIPLPARMDATPT